MPQNGYRHGFTTLDQETTIDNLPVDGQMPAWLNGVLLRNGPARFEFGNTRYRHWFDGSAMLHRFQIVDGAVSYANRYLRTPAYEGNAAAGEITFTEFATDPCRSIFQRVMSAFSPQQPGHNANVNLTRLGDAFIAMTETPLPVAFDPDTLDTIGVVDYADSIGFVGTTAHPHYDPQRNAGVQHLIEYGRESAYSFAFIPNEKPLRRQLVNRTTVAEPGYVHSFGMTERYLILAECPLVVNPLKLLLSGKPFIENFVWKPEQGARFLVVDKASGDLVREVSADPFFTFHHVNAFEDGDDIVLDISAYDDDGLVRELYLDQLRAEDGGRLSFAELRRYRLPADGGRATVEALSPVSFELPRINYRYNGKPYRYAYGSGVRPNAAADFINALVKVDIEARESTLWFEDNCYPGEPVFVAAPDATAEDDGVILSVVLDGVNRTSYLLVLDAASFTEMARASVPHHVPFGFHGQFFGR